MNSHFERLTEAVDWSYRRQQVDRFLHQSMIRLLGGEYYPTHMGEGGPQTPIPLLSLAARAMSRYLISKSPRVLVTTADPRWKSWAENCEISTNKRILQSNCGEVLRECVGQSMVSFGTLFLAPIYRGTPQGMELDLAVESIDRADYVYDITSPTLENPDFEGHKFNMKIADLRDYPRFDESARMKVNDTGVSDGPSDETSNFRKESGRRTTLYDYAEIFCVYDRPRNKLVYYPRAQPTLLLAEEDWMGPRHGPYRKLYYEKLPGNAIPLAPLMHLITKHKAFNVLDMKAIHQQQVAKGLLFYTNASKNEAEEIVNAVCDQSVLQENGAVRYGQVGGAAPDTVAMAEKQKRDFSYATCGMVDQFLKQADTLGQERLLRGASNEMLEDMSGWAYQFVKGFAQDVFWFDVRDPNGERRTVRKPAPGVDLSYEAPWTVEHRKFAARLEFDVDVEPYSYVDRSPDSRLADLLGAIQIIMGIPDRVAQGISLDVDALVRTIGRLKNLPELYDVLILNQDPERLQQLLGAREGGPARPDDTAPKRYIRESRSDGAGAEQEIMRMFGRSEKSPEMAVM